ncbi:MAG: ABC transporter substrate-binding protein [Microbacterium sp.]|uniref:ABC transporter substrate-binding protein n=1 Tax=Microbacterium sp. TaxID=51671 RepID=UPI003F7DEAD1
MSEGRVARSRRGIAVAMIAIAALAATACSSSGAEPNSTASDLPIGGTLQLATSTPGAYSSFDPWSAGFGINNSLWISQAVYDSLVHLDGDGQPVPSVATSWEVDGETVTLELREGIEFADGTPLDAEAVKANLDYAGANAAGAECNSHIEGITTDVVSATSVKLTLPHPMPDLLQNFGQCAGFIVNPKALETEGALSSDADGTGPYTVNTAETNISQSRFVFDRNPDYWDKENPARFQKIVLTGYESRTAAINAVRGGQADVLANQPPREVANIGIDVLQTVPQQLNGAWIMDTTGDLVEPLGDVRVRQALNYALDREAIGKAIFGEDLEIVGSTPFPSFYDGYKAELEDFYTYDPDKARELLEDAGYADGFALPVLISPNGQQLAEAYAGYLADIGVDMQLSVHTSDYISEMLTGNWPMIFANFTLNPAQLQTVEGVVGPNGFWNPRGNSDPAVEKLIEEIQNTPVDDTDTITDLYEELSTVIAEQALLVTPFIIPAAMAFNADKAEISELVPGLSVPMLYDLVPPS